MPIQKANADQTDIDAVSYLLNGTSFEIRSDRYSKYELSDMTRTIKNWSVMYRNYQEEGQLDIAEFYIDYMRDLFGQFERKNGGRLTCELIDSALTGQHLDIHHCTVTGDRWRARNA